MDFGERVLGLSGTVGIHSLVPLVYKQWPVGTRAHGRLSAGGWDRYTVIDRISASIDVSLTTTILAPTVQVLLKGSLSYEVLQICTRGHICIQKCTRPMLFLHNRTAALHKCTPTGSLVPSRGIVVKTGKRSNSRHLSSSH